MSSRDDAPIEDLMAAEALADTLGSWSDWVIRRVDSVHPMVGMRGRLKHSIDCIPPIDPRLAYDRAERNRESIHDVHGHIMIPLAYIEKGPMRHLDAMDSAGHTMSLLGSHETTALLTDALVLVLTGAGVPRTAHLRFAVEDLLAKRGSLNRKRTQVLVDTGRWEDRPLWNSPLELPQDTVEFLLILSTHFILMGLIPAERAGHRQVLKFSYHWVLEAPSAFERGKNLLVALGVGDLEIKVRMHMPAETASYHLEFQAPQDLDMKMLRLPETGSDVLGEALASVDTAREPVAHASHRYQHTPTSPALVRMGVPARGLWTSTVVASAVTSAVFIIATFLDGALDALRAQQGSAAALLLAAPAVFIGFLSARTEHAFSSQVLNPLRGLLVTCSLLLFIMAGSIVGTFDQALILWVWRCSATLSGSIFSTLIAVRLYSWIMYKSSCLVPRGEKSA